MSHLAESWRRYGGALRWLGVAYLAVAAAGKLSYALPHLLRDVATWSALDLKYRYHEVAEWFAGRTVYGVVDGAVYPPASHVILWPFMGWASLETARLLWAVTILLAAVVLCFILYRVTAAAPARDRLLVAGLALAAYPLQQSVFVGQLGVHVAAMAAAGALLLLRAKPHAGSDTLAAVLLAGSLVKPQLSVPLVAVGLIAAARMRPVLLTGLIYGGLTVLAAAVQPAGLIRLVRDWLAIAGSRVSFHNGVPSVHMLLDVVGAGAWMTLSSLLLLAALAAWAWRTRQADPWILMGVAAIATRFWAHSIAYDDAFLLLPAAALMRITYADVRGSPGEGEPDDERRRRVTGALFALAWAALLTPTWAFYSARAAVVWTLHGAHTLLWLVVLAWLGILATRSAVRTRPDNTTR
jgi:hypothetical protein